jgi:hypothetical protein
VCEREINLSRDKIVTLSEPFYNDPLAHLDCVIKNYRKWVWRHLDGKDESNPWRKSLPADILEWLQKEMEEEKRKLEPAHNIERCHYCGKFVTTKSKCTPELYRGRKRFVHTRCFRKRISSLDKWTSVKGDTENGN